MKGPSISRSEPFYHTLFDLVPDPMAITNFDNGHIIDVNQAFVIWSHYPRDELIGRTTAELGFWMDNEKRSAVLGQLYNTRFVDAVEVEFRIAGGELRQIVFSGRLIETSGNKWFLSVAHDITERKRAEDELREREVLLKTYLENAPDGIYTSDIKGNFLYGNRKCEEIIGYGRDELIGKNFLELNLLSKRSLEKAVELLGANVESRSTGPDEIELINKKGLSLPVEISTSVVQHSDQKIVLAFVRDITDRKQVEATLQQRESYLSAIIENQPGLVWLKDTESRFLAVNHAFAISCGKRRVEELVGKTDLDIWPSELAQKYRRDDSSIMKTGKHIIIEELIYDRGEARWFETFKTPVLDGQGTIIGTTGYARDITERKQTEEALKRSEANFRSLFENAVEGIFQTTPEGTFISANPSQARIFGFDSPRELMEQFTDIGGQHYANPEDRKIYKSVLESEGVIRGFETQLLKKDGRRVWASINARAVRDSEGVVINYEGTLEDITDRKNAEEILRQNELFLEEIQRISRLGGWKANPHTDYLEWTGGVYEIIEAPRDYKPGLSEGLKVFLPQYIPIIQDKVAKCLVTGESFKVECEAITLTGRKLWTEVRGLAPIVEGTRSYVIGTFQDVTSRKQAEEEILRERSKLKTLSDNASFGMVLVGKDGHFDYINTRFTALFGYSLPDIPDGRTWFRKAYPNVEYRHAVISTWIKDLGDARPGERKPRVFTVTCRDGTQKIVSFIPSVIVSGDYLMTCEDITELRRLESQLRQAQKMEAIGTLAGGIAHDFNNILTALMGYASLMQQKIDKTSPLRPYVDQVLSASEKAADLTRSLLAFGRKQPVVLTPLDINDTIKTTKKLLKRLLTEDIELHTSLAGEDMIVIADRSQVDQILFNLVTNARDAMPKGGRLSIETKLFDMDEKFKELNGYGNPGKYALLIISDTGCGMDELTRDKIFDPFFTTKEIGKGTGLGLATVYGIVQQHNGYVSVDSEPGRGTTFHIYLPASVMNMNEEQTAAPSIERGNETVLIAEDDEGVRHFMREALQQYGYKIIEATDGEDAIDKFNRHRNVSLVIIDSVMPKKNGREVYEEIHGTDPETRVLFTSGYTKDVILDKGVEDGEFDFIPKPLSFDKLLQKVREVLDR